MLCVTVDTNTIYGDRIDRIRKATAGLDVDIRATTVTHREHSKADQVLRFTPIAETGVHDESNYDSGALYADEPIPETMVWNESRWGQAVWGGSTPVYETMVLDESRLGSAVLGDNDAPLRFEQILGVIGDGSFPKPERRETLTDGERRQLRDAMILLAHARECRDILVSDDVKAFIGKDGEKRRKLESLCGIRIMTVDEFCDYAAALPRELTQ